MSIRKDLMTLMALLIKNEETVADLYETFAERFSEHQELWLSLSREEIEHANWIRTLCTKVEKGEIAIREDRFNVHAVQMSLDYLLVLIGNARKQMSLPMALSLALQIEDSILEKKFYDVFESDSEELKRVFRFLALGTQEHARRLQQTMGELKRAPKQDAEP